MTTSRNETATWGETIREWVWIAMTVALLGLGFQVARLMERLAVIYEQATTLEAARLKAEELERQRKERVETEDRARREAADAKKLPWQR